MKGTLLCVVMVALWSAGAASQGTHVANDSLTGLPILPAASGSPVVAMPPATICKSDYHGNFYSLGASKTEEVVSWFASHLTHFTKTQNATGSTIVFANRDRTLVVIVMGKPAGSASSVAYERYQPGLAPKTVASLTQGKILCK